MRRPTVCLNMILKNEAHVIRRCLESVVPFIDTWVIIDDDETTDGTEVVIRDFMHESGKPGELYRLPWSGFDGTRNAAFHLARHAAEYCLMLDADEVFIAPADFSWPELNLDGYELRMRSGASDVHFWLNKLVRTSIPWEYRGVVHEALYCDAPHTKDRLQGPLIHGLFDSAQNNVPQEVKYTRHAQILTESLQKEPNNARYWFYLGQSWRDAKQYQKSIEAYRHRAEMGGWDEEVWYSLYQIARNLEVLGRNDEAIVAYLKAYQYRPTRSEPLVDLATLHRGRGELHLAYAFANWAIRIPLPDDTLFLDESVYRWRAVDELAIAAYWTGRYQESANLAQCLLNEHKLPDDQRARVLKNLEFAAGQVR